MCQKVTTSSRIDFDGDLICEVPSMLITRKTPLHHLCFSKHSTEWSDFDLDGIERNADIDDNWYC